MAGTEELEAEISRLESEQDDLVRQARELRTGLADAGPMDAADRAATLEQAEELEALAEQLGRRRERVQRELDGS